MQFNKQTRATIMPSVQRVNLNVVIVLLEAGWVTETDSGKLIQLAEMVSTGGAGYSSLNHKLPVK
jgi:hypothetical protein